MRKIEVLGSGCPKCQKLYAEAEAAVRSTGIECRVEKVTEIEKIMAAGVLSTPALVLDGKVLSMGRVPSAEEIGGWIRS